jgi:hypothetical protein
LVARPRSRSILIVCPIAVAIAYFMAGPWACATLGSALIVCAACLAFYASRQRRAA